MEREKFIIENLSDLASQVSLQATACLQPVFVNGVSTENYQAVWNNKSGKVASIVSKQYQIIQHSDVLQAVTETLGRLNLNVKGRLDIYNNKIQADLIFQDGQFEIKDDAKGIKLGIRVINSYDKSASFRLEMYGYRTVCANGMSLGTVMQVREVTFHTGSEKQLETISSITEKFIHQVINSNEKLQEYVNRAIGDSLEWEIVDKLLAGLFQTEKHRKAIEERLNELQTVTRWNIYNAITSYLTHDQSLTSGVTAYMERKAERILKNSGERLMVELTTN